MNSFHLARKRFGQHFLKDSIILQKIIKAINPRKTDIIVEIGPGQGELTGYLIHQCAKLILVEIDKNLVSILQKKYRSLKNLVIYQSDALQLDFLSLKKTYNSLRIVGNLPYNISIPLLFRLFTQIESIKDMHFMLQKEVALRLIAPVGNTNYGRLSVMTQFFCDNILLFNAPPKAFIPSPKVESAFVRLIPRKNKNETLKNLDFFSTLVKEAFTYRRKTIVNALKKLVPIGQWNMINDINFKARPQELRIEDFIKISVIMSKLVNL
ncbi:16S rRNA (adenine(1518)-N(6)/adenine(1519)-N(6))-dimethyltransferase RsmA [Coxiella endosymbiont of Amblyomma americanum]|uniref:16S rRNA (adenine(1518)-N(6)/adenine(1519)-N(6))- dimethyltransferase RsmA n=1 Tax=Coxiella endosymbiont of Amblyomma americanum TaxID=325775 RepID=UPI00057F3CBC|nr:16S rRNA (adenine(1518)-N(6)/adenine(1519)-N(6))-dimethyltransferase RsmA [Coxiella endosymbiont of Amblyomma americanum]AJC50364.1 ribosomal RNA small subunit methyltransferase A [Coxiella endosymbiont of Amblyomma americanum]AUJ58708.1 16S rRNA (adenine(1518)-N(6)/adenine(1519)-N(6))-dimethyltransferase [Coxiella-like endosymbiont of Amblyomma americanum]